MIADDLAIKVIDGNGYLFQIRYAGYGAQSQAYAYRTGKPEFDNGLLVVRFRDNVYDVYIPVEET